MNTHLRKWFAPTLVVFFFIFGLFLRTFRLDALPSEPHRDELSIGYSAYSLVKTGYDEHGAGPWPLMFRSFGDFKLPGLIYTTALSVWLFDLSLWSTRLPTAILAACLIPLMYLFVKELFGSKNIALTAAGMITVTYWHTFLARTAYEPIVGLTFTISGVWLLLKGLQRPLFIYLSLPFFAAAFMTYNVPLLGTPFLIFLYAIVYGSKKLNFKQHGPALALVLFLCASMLAGFATLNKAKAKTTVLQNPELTSQLQSLKDKAFLAGTPAPVRLLATNKYMFGLDILLKNYSSTFDPRYLFFNGGKNEWHSLSQLQLGDYSKAYLLLLIVGVWTVARKSIKGSRPHLFLLGYLLLSPIPDAFTIDAPVKNRLMEFHFLLEITAAVGLTEIIQYKATGWLKLSKWLFGLFYLALTGVFWSRYLYLHSSTLAPAWNETISQMAKSTMKIHSNYDWTYINPREIPGQFDSVTVPYIYFLFYGQVDPKIVQTQGVWQERGGFSTLVGLPGFSFDEYPESIEPGQNYLYVTRTKAYELNSSLFVQPIYEISDRAGKVTWKAFDIKPSLEL